MQVYNDEIYHYGKLGMKWGHHKAQVKAKKEKQKAEDLSILDARKKTGKAMENYNRKANHANNHMNDKKAQDDADKAFDDFIKLAQKSKQKTNQERNKQKSIIALSVIGSLTLSTVGAAMGNIK